MILPQNKFSESIESLSVFALHGFTGAGRDFDFLRTFFPENVDWNAPDLPALPPNELFRFLRERWEKLEGKRRVLIGYSMGGRLALHLAQMKSFWREGDVLVLVSASPGIDDSKERKERARVDNALAETIEMSASSEAFYSEWQKTPLISTQSRLPSPWRERLLENRRAADRRIWAEHLRQLGTGALPSLWGKLENIATPETLIFAGEIDEKFCRIAKKMNKLLPRSQVFIVPESGHTPHFEQGKMFSELIKNALAVPRAAL